MITRFKVVGHTDAARIVRLTLEYDVEVDIWLGMTSDGLVHTTKGRELRGTFLELLGILLDVFYKVELS